MACAACNRAVPSLGHGRRRGGGLLGGSFRLGLLGRGIVALEGVAVLIVARALGERGARCGGQRGEHEEGGEGSKHGSAA